MADDSALITNSSNATAEFECLSLSVSEDPVAARVLLILVHIATLSVLWTFARRMHERVKVGHPVFAVTFQSVVVMCVTETFVLLLSVPLVLDLDPTQIFLTLYDCLSQSTLQFYQVSWLIVTIMR